MEKIIYLPIDERFTTRDAFLNLAKLTPYNVLTPPRELLPSKKKTINLNTLHNWINNNIKKGNILILSAEMFLYGGLINSRLSFDKQEILEKRLSKIITYKKENPGLKIYLSTVIMRIPAYNLNLEEPDFWQCYGKDIFDYSFHTHRYEVLQEKKDEIIAKKLKEKIPEKYLKEFLWRRKRNHQITRQLLKLDQELNLFEGIYITLDDNAEFGFNKKEEEILREMIKELQLNSRVNIYPGADEVGLTMLARVAIDLTAIKPSFKIVYRVPSNKNLIPNYEGQPLDQSIKEQLKGAGAKISDDGDIILLVNNFSNKKQLEAGMQPEVVRADYNSFKKYNNMEDKVIALADIRYSNGGDLSFMKWIKKSCYSLENIAYAGWNTNGNTLGTVIANSILLYLYQNSEANKYFNTLRLLEDLIYQAKIRTELMDYINKNKDSIYDLSSKLNFYRNFVQKRMSYEYLNIKKKYDLPYKIKNVYFPWQRTFEIGIELEE